jgi:hypothetical protein
VSDSENNPLNSLLSSFALGPAWARAGSDATERKPKTFPQGEAHPPRRDNRDRDSRNNGGERAPSQGRRANYEDRRSSPPRMEEAPPEEGVRTSIIPDSHAIHLIGKEVHQVARVYPLFDIAKIILAEKSRCRAVFETVGTHAPLLRGKMEESVFLTREEAIHHLWNSELRSKLIEEETIEVEPPTGNFQAIARCGISGDWLGPVNFHSYQTNLRRLHRERFSRMPFENYASKVRIERGEDAVNSWLETMKTKTRWRIKDEGDDAWIEDRAEAERALGMRCFERAFEEVRIADVSGAIHGKNLSPSLLTSLRIAGTHARNHPAILIPAVCRAIEAEHLAVFKRQGKLHTGPARPHPLPLNAILAERPGKMVEWIRNNKPAKLEGLWKSVLPEGSTAPPADYAADLFWLLHQGHILLYPDDTLAVQEAREAGIIAPGDEPKKAKKKKKSQKTITPAETEPDKALKDQESVPSETSETSATQPAADSAHPPETPSETPSEPTEAPAIQSLHEEPTALTSESPAESPPEETAEETAILPAAIAEPSSEPTGEERQPASE